MLTKIISGDQTGADQAALAAARDAGFETGGWIGGDFLTEDGPRPDLAELHGMEVLRDATGVDGYRRRTDANCWGSDATLWFGDPDSPGGRRARSAIADRNRHCATEMCPEAEFLAIPHASTISPRQIAEWLLKRPQLYAVHVGGNRGSRMPDGGKWVYDFVLEVLRIYKELVDDKKGG